MSDTDFLPLLPFAALVSDIERFVESVNSAQSVHQGPGPLILAFQNVLTSPRYYSHEAGCRDSHIHRILFVANILRSKLDCGPRLSPFISDDFLVIKRTLLNVDEYDDSPLGREGDCEAAQRFDAGFFKYQCRIYML